MQAPTEDHLKVAKHALRYLHGIIDYDVVYNPNNAEQYSQAADFDCVQRQNLMLYADAYVAAGLETRRSTTGNIMFF
jgi:hypothetical protein